MSISRKNVRWSGSADRWLEWCLNKDYTSTILQIKHIYLQIAAKYVTSLSLACFSIDRSIQICAKFRKF